MGQNNGNHPYDKETKHSISLDATCHYLIDVLSLKSHSVPLLFQAKGRKPSRHCAHDTSYRSELVAETVPFWGKWAEVIQIFILLIAAAAGTKYRVEHETLSM